LLNLDWLEPESTVESAPVLIILPGITGHSKSGYLVHLVNGAFEHGWRVAVLVYPGTDLSKVKTARFIRGHVPHDLEIALDHIHARYSTSPVYAVGYSMGAALLTKYLAHHGKKSRIAAAISCSNPFDVLYSFQCISKGLVNKLYNMHFLSALKKMYQTNLQVFQEAFPHLTPEEVLAISSVEEYDSKITMKHFGFEDLHEYYISLGCKDSVEDVAVPMLVAHARDDPIVPIDAIPLNSLKANPNIITMITGMGGHTGWLQGLNPMGPSWFDEVALEWIFHVDDYLKEHKKVDHHLNLAPLTNTTRLLAGANAEVKSRKAGSSSTTSSNELAYLESLASLGSVTSNQHVKAKKNHATTPKSPNNDKDGAKSPNTKRAPAASPEPVESNKSPKSSTPKKSTSSKSSNGADHNTPKSPKGRK